MKYKHIHLKSFNNVLKIEVNENIKPDKWISAGGQVQLSVHFEEWLQSCELLDFANKEESDKFYRQVGKTINLEHFNYNDTMDISHLVEIKYHCSICDAKQGDLCQRAKDCARNDNKDIARVYCKQPIEESQESLWDELFEITWDTNCYMSDSEKLIKSKFIIKRK